MYKTVAGKTMFPPDTPLSVHIHTYAYIAKSASKAKKDGMLKGLIRPMAKPDTDNIAKCILDALNKVAYPDDKQIVELSVSKYYSDNPCVVVEITEAEKGEP
jgi:Holliday junction resolvase RusA-like endonuclease